MALLMLASPQSRPQTSARCSQRLEDCGCDTLAELMLGVKHLPHVEILAGTPEVGRQQPSTCFPLLLEKLLPDARLIDPRVSTCAAWTEDEPCTVAQSDTP